MSTYMMQTLPSLPSAPSLPVLAPKRYPSQEQWRALRPWVTKLYKVNKLTAHTILLRLNDLGFYPTEKVLRDRFRDWGVNDKNKKRVSSVSSGDKARSTGRRRQIPAVPSGVETVGRMRAGSSFGSTPAVTTPESSDSFVSPASQVIFTPDEASSEDGYHGSEGSFSMKGGNAANLTFGICLQRPLPTCHEDIPAKRVMASVQTWYDDSLPRLLQGNTNSSDCPVLELMNGFHAAFYFLDTGGTERGLALLKDIGSDVDRALCTNHPAAIMQLLQALSLRKLADRQSADEINEGGDHEVVNMLEGRLRVIECDSCDAPINDTHLHCDICNGSFDLCRQCASSGAHCLDQSHMLKARLIRKGVVTEAPARTALSKPRPHTIVAPTSRRRTSQRLLLYANDSSTSREAMPIVFRLLLRRAHEICGTQHPITLLLAAFQRYEDWPSLCINMVQITKDQLARNRLSNSNFRLSTQLRLLCTEVLLQQGLHQELEDWISAISPIHVERNDTEALAEMKRLLAMSKAEQNYADEALTLLSGALDMLADSNHEYPVQSDRILNDYASLCWRLGRLDQCAKTLGQLMDRWRSAKQPDVQRRFVLCLKKAVLLRMRRNEEAAVLCAAHPDIFGRTTSSS